MDKINYLPQKKHTAAQQSVSFSFAAKNRPQQRKLQIEDIKNTTLFHLAYTPCVQYSLAKKVIINKNLAQTSNAQWKQKRFCFVLFVSFAKNNLKDR